MSEILRVYFGTMIVFEIAWLIYKYKEDTNE